MSQELDNVTPPTLPQAGREYSAAFENQFTSILRLFFGRLTSTLNLLNTAWGRQFVGLTFAVADLPTAADYPGARTFVTDATATVFASVVAGGGANGVPVYSDGADWRIG